MGKYHNDQPIKGGPNDPDLLNRASFANHLANILLLNPEEDCLTVSLEGEWGFGKTSIINLTKAALKEKDVIPIIVEYNPWIAGSPESLIQDFLIQFSSQLNIKNNSDVALKAAQELIAYSNLFSVAKLIPGTEPWASIIGKVIRRFGSTTKKIAKLKELDLIGKKINVVQALSSIDSPIIVFIDDVDRLTPKETFQILRLVKAVADFPGTSFLLAFDPQYLHKVLKSHGIDNSAEYIDKVVQLRLPLPIISDRDMNYLASVELERLSEADLTSSFEKDQERLNWIYHEYFKHLINNPRELKRFFNHLRFVLEQVEGQVCFSDLFGLSILAIKANNVYEHIKSNPAAYIGRRFSSGDYLLEKPEDTVNNLAPERDSHLKLFNQGEELLTKGLLSELFPFTNPESLSLFGVSSDDAAGRVSAIQRLYVALHYKTPTGYIADVDILSFINGNINRKIFVEDTIKNESTDRFFEMMSNYSKECKDKELKILYSVYDAFLPSDELRVILDSNHGFLTFDPLQQMAWLTYRLISNTSNKTSLLRSLINRKKNAPISADLIFKIREQIETQKGGNTYQEVWVDSDIFSELENDFTEAAVQTLNNMSFIDSNLESHIFYELKRCSKDSTSKLLSDLLTSSRGIIRIAEIIGRSGTDSSKGPYAAIAMDYFKEVINFSELQNKASEALSQQQNLSVPVRAVLKSITDGKKYYLRDGKVGQIH